MADLKKRIKESFLKTNKSFNQLLPVLLGVIGLIALFIALVPKEFYQKIFTGNKILDPLIGALLGSFATGNPITSYIIGGELLRQQVSLIAVVAFILAWVTVGFVQLPAEIAALGKKFAISRNVFSFISALIIAILTVATLSVL